MSISRFTLIFVAVSLATLMLPTTAIRVPHSAKLHRRLTFVAKAPPAAWDADSLEDYQQYHIRYLGLGCHKKKGQKFFETCCHPRSKKESVENLPVECILDPQSTIKALYVIKASVGHANLTEGKTGQPIFVPNGTIQTLQPQMGCNGSELPTTSQLQQLALVSEHLQQFSNLSQVSNFTHYNWTDFTNSTAFGNLTYFTNLTNYANFTHFANFTTLNITQLLQANLTQFLAANITQISNITSVCQPDSPVNSSLTQGSNVLVSSKSADQWNTSSAEETTNSWTAPVETESTSEAASEVNDASEATAASESKAAAEAKAASNVKAAADAQAAADAKASADAQAASQSQPVAQPQPAAQSSPAPQPQPASEAKASYAVPAIGNVLSGLSQVFGADGDAKATFFYQQGGTGACGNVNADSTPLVALPADLYANGAHCGKNVRILNTANGKSVTAKVQDMCPGCPSGTSLDLSTGAFDAIGSQDTGVLPIEWGFV